jgi:signal peptidase I
MVSQNLAAVAFVLFFLFFSVFALRMIFFLARVEGNSMRPTLIHDEHVLALRLWPKQCIKNGHIIITKIGETPWMQQSKTKVLARGVYIKRVVGLPGDSVVTELSKLPNDLQTEIRNYYDKDGYRKWSIPERFYFIKSDFGGLDSTIVGPVSFSAFMGLVIAKLPFAARSRVSAKS